MEKLIGTIFSEVTPPRDADVSIHNNTLYVKKWNWDYQDCLLFQKSAQRFISQKRKLRIYIFCNHPHCFTLGRGNERGQSELVDFNPELENKLNFPLYKIHRGGGITFHYPGQWIFYPIVSINENYSLEDHMCWQLKTVKEVLKSTFNLGNVMAAKKLMGVWYERQKLASIGVGLNRFVTEHGLALNLVYDKTMFNELLKINPCGMNSETYTSLDKIKDISTDNLIEKFHQSFLDSFTEILPC